MTALDVILFSIFAMFVLYLVTVAATEPRYTWRDIATTIEKFTEAWRELNNSMEQLSIAIGKQLLPAMKRVANSFNGFRRL